MGCREGLRQGGDGLLHRVVRSDVGGKGRGPQSASSRWGGTAGEGYSGAGWGQR